MSYFLYSVDLEDVRDRIPDSTQYAPRVPEMTRKYLAFLAKHNARATFFVEGRCAEYNKELIQEIILAGHELACHTHTHVHLKDVGPDGLRRELDANLTTLTKLGATNVCGFRAPCLSLTKETLWAYEVLTEFNLSYSSSVLSTKRLYGSKQMCGTSLRRIKDIYEIPLSVCNMKLIRFPYGGGIHFRVLPWPILHYAFNRATARQEYIAGYFHPYDIDFEQVRFRHPEVGHNPILNALMYCGRKSVLQKLERLLSSDLIIIPYREYLRKQLELESNYSY